MPNFVQSASASGRDFLNFAQALTWQWNIVWSRAPGISPTGGTATFNDLAREFEALRRKNERKPCQVSNLRKFAPIGQEPLSAMLEEDCRSVSEFIRRVRRSDDYAIC